MRGMFLSRTPCKLVQILLAAFILSGGLARADTFPGINNDEICSTQPAGGPTGGADVCFVDEGGGDTLHWTVINLLAVPVLINSVAAGPITPIAGDPTDFITSDPITADACSGVTLAPAGGSCLFNQSFTTGTPGDLDDNPPLPVLDGESLMSYVLTFTLPNGNPNLPGPANNLNAVGIGPGVGGLVNNNGTYTLILPTAEVNVFDAPEPSTLGLLGFGLTGLWVGFLRRRNRKILH